MILLYVLFIVLMCLWAYNNGAPARESAGGWLPWLCVLLLGIAVFVIRYYPGAW